MEQSLHRHAHRVCLLTILSALSAHAAASSPTTTVTHLPNVQINAAKVDAAGNIYLVGAATTSAASGAAYIAKLRPDGTSLYAVSLGGNGSSTSAATTLDLDSAGDVYVSGTTTAADFPVSGGQAPSPGSTAFAAKLDAKGNVLYSTLIGGNTTTAPRSIVINSKGELVVSGQQTAPTNVVSLFLLKLSADGTQVVSGPPGIGGLVAVDAQDDIYVAGVPPFGATDPASTPGAFQGVPPTSYCGCPFLNFVCGGDQFVASVTPDLGRTRFLTYVTAHYGARPAYMALDAQGNVLLAGTTSAPGYPTTSASYQPTYSALNKIVLTCGPPVPMEVTSPAGYVTLLKGDGSGLIYSTFFSGSNSDNLTFATLTGAGIYLGGQAGSVDLPGFDGAVPSACVPVGFVTRMTLDGSAVSASHTPPGTPLAYDSTSGTLLLASGSDLIRFDPTQPTSIACVLDSADMRPVSTVAPGELLTMFGRFRYFGTDPVTTVLTPVNGVFPVTSQSLGIAANQTPSPLLYISEPQVNFQAPYEIAGSSQANLTLTYTDVNGNQISDSRTLPVAASNPVAFLSQPYNFSQNSPLALNADGTANSLTNPATAESVVTMFIDGLGVGGPTPTTGSVNPSPAAPLNIPVVIVPVCGGTFCNPAPTLVSASSLPGSISGVIQVQLLTPANVHPSSAYRVVFSLSVGSVAVRDMNLSFWVK
jgi:uncharacterized protein (TIGR03437 family)